MNAATGTLALQAPSDSSIRILAASFLAPALKPLLYGTAIAFGVGGCATPGALQLAGIAVGGAMTAVLESTGIKSPAGGADAAPRQPIAITIHGGDALNTSDSGEALSVVVRLYQLRSETGFSAMSQIQAEDERAGLAALGDELVTVREITVLPGRTYRLQEHLDGAARFIGLVALFHTAAPGQWKVAFAREGLADSGIAIVLHACAMSVVGGKIASSGAGSSLSTFAGSRCGIRQGVR